MNLAASYRQTARQIDKQDHILSQADNLSQLGALEAKQQYRKKNIVGQNC